MSTAIWWIRRDLRLNDNNALSYALEHFEKVIPFFILDPSLISTPFCKRDQFLIQALKSLNEYLNTKGSRLILRKGDPLPVLTNFFNESNAERIIAERDFSPYARKRDGSVANKLPLILVDGLTAYPPESIFKSNGSPYTVYTPYSKMWKSLPSTSIPGSAPIKLPPVDADLIALPLPNNEVSFLDFPANEINARDRLESFLSHDVFSYKENRNYLSINGTSRLSVYFKFGLISINEAVYKVQKIIKAVDNAIEKTNCITWLNELIWREFYFSILFHFPFVTQIGFRENLRSINWDNNAFALQAWQQGLTGYPVVDAGMRQLNTIGWMHNRARMITASFLVKDLLINWQEGEKWFMHHLIDGDIASNNGGWQWSAGTGTDAAPYFRIFNPVLQSKKFDPEGNYIRRWVPELAHLDKKQIHTPWEISNFKINYPKPIVDHHFARERALQAFKTAKNNANIQSK